MTSTPEEPAQSTHLHYLKHALSLARLSPPKPTNFRVGCVIVSYPTGLSEGEILSTGYTLEIPGNTHAEQNALAKLAQKNALSGEESGEVSWNEILSPEKNVFLYTSLEPCGLRLSGATPCVQRIIATRRGVSGRDGGAGLRKVIFGAREPGTFVQDSQSLKMLDVAGVLWEHVAGLDEEILKVAKDGHVTTAGETKKELETNIDDISPEERTRQEQQPRNPKKRMMEVDLSR